MSKRKDKALQILTQKLVFKGFSPKTIKSYFYHSKQFLDYLDKSSQSCDKKPVR